MGRETPTARRSPRLRRARRVPGFVTALATLATLWLLLPVAYGARWPTSSPPSSPHGPPASGLPQLRETVASAGRVTHEPVQAG